jgi:predicted DNA-binding transcriptional regulator AlpA
MDIDIEAAGVRGNERDYLLPEKQMYNLREFAALTGISMTAVRRGIRESDLPIMPVRIGGAWKFPRRPVDKLVGLDD